MLPNQGPRRDFPQQKQCLIPRRCNQSQRVIASSSLDTQCTKSAERRRSIGSTEDENRTAEGSTPPDSSIPRSAPPPTDEATYLSSTSPPSPLAKHRIALIARNAQPVFMKAIHTARKSPTHRPSFPKGRRAPSTMGHLKQMNPASHGHRSRGAAAATIVRQGGHSMANDAVGRRAVLST